MNAATRAAVRYCVKQGHVPLVVYNGFRGLLDDNIHEVSWLGVDGWTARGGSELGTNRTLPDVDLGAVASRFQEHNLHALMLIGGFEAFNSLLILDNARKLYPSFNIPMVHLPATISNNVPLTEFSLGSDTSLNALVDACDSIKQSASASRNRVFVVETQGGKCGYIATMGALAVCTPFLTPVFYLLGFGWCNKTGASLVYTPEQGMDLDLLRDDVKFLKLRFGLDVKGKSEGRLVIRCVFTLPPISPHNSLPQKRMRVEGLHDRRHHENARRRRRRPLRLALRLPRTHPPRRRSLTHGPCPRHPALPPVHVFSRGTPRAAESAAGPGQGRARGERGGNYDPGECHRVGACASDGEACGYEESEGEGDVVGGHQGFGGGTCVTAGVVVNTAAGIDEVFDMPS